MTIEMLIGTASWLIMVLGYYQRKHRRSHIMLMLTAIFSDLGLVIFLQITRKASQTALEFSLPLLQQLHILFSLLAVISYIPVLLLGAALIRGKTGLLPYHRVVGMATLILRTLGFVFMFSMLKN
ncbi:MAG: hypothetical protein D6719_08225 [Candidatus Dadabacteria bacterium]|nr:MAG: hypothetical protein D6719_08225 [Candidatus Dadabacteria bacterium]